MTNNDRLQQIMSNVQLLNDLAKGMVDAEMYPVSFFSQGFDLIQKIQSDFHTIEADQVDMFAEQLKKHQALILSIYQQMRTFSTQTQVLIPPVIEQALPIQTSMMTEKQSDASGSAPVVKPMEVITKPTEEVVTQPETVVKPTEEVVKPSETVTKPSEEIINPPEIVVIPPETVAIQPEQNAPLQDVDLSTNKLSTPEEHTPPAIKQSTSSLITEQEEQVLDIEQEKEDEPTVEKKKKSSFFNFLDFSSNTKTNEKPDSQTYTMTETREAPLSKAILIDSPEVEQEKPVQTDTPFSTPPANPAPPIEMLVVRPDMPVPTKAPPKMTAPPIETSIARPARLSPPIETPVARPTRPAPPIETPTARPTRPMLSNETIATQSQPPVIHISPEPASSNTSSGVPSFLAPLGTVASSDKTINDVASKEVQQPTVNDSIEKKKLSDLRKAFNVNDRYRYRKELFGGSEDTMNKVIIILNSRRSYSDCVLFLEQKLHWNLKDPTVKDFLKILETRF